VDRKLQRKYQHKHGGIIMKPSKKSPKKQNQHKQAEIQLCFIFDCRQAIVSESSSLNALENIKKIIKKSEDDV
jgi:ABC-type dipeptide/oligopeptide/nickel transport system ATPase subunit